MSTTSASRVEAPSSGARPSLVWDAPTRAFHWLLVLSFAGAWLTSESERWRVAHMTFGYTMAGLVAFRLAWGLFGTRYARFASFVRGPRAVARYLRSLARGEPEHHVGHNPAGAVAIVALLVMIVLLTVSGLAAADLVAAEWLSDAHEGIANAMLAVVGVHLAGVLAGSVLHRENLVGSMISGRKPVAPEHGIARAWRGVAAIMLVAVLGFWSLQWQGAVLPGTAVAGHFDRSSHHHDGHGEDDD